jgi:hypothetical protein
MHPFVRTHINQIHFRLPRFIITEAKAGSAADPAAEAEKRLEPVGQRPRGLEFPAAFHIVRLQLPAGASHAGGAAGIRALSGQVAATSAVSRLPYQTALAAAAAEPAEQTAHHQVVHPSEASHHGPVHRGRPAVQGAAAHPEGDPGIS